MAGCDGCSDPYCGDCAAREWLEANMKTYIVYVDGEELPRDKWVKAGSHNAAEKKAQAKYPGKQVSVAYTEV